MNQFYERQRKFTLTFLADRGLTPESIRANPELLVKWVKEYAYHIEGEVRELVDEFPWRMHAPTSAVPYVRSNVLEEWTDVYKFLLGLGVILGFEPAELEVEFHRKSSVVEQKYEQERLLATLPADATVVAVDVDDVLADHRAAFEEFCREARPELPVGLLTRTALRAALGTAEYERLKGAFRESGRKARLPVRPGARALLSALRGAGRARVVILSARPVKRYARLWGDTLSWLGSNGLEYDALFFDAEKHLRVLNHLPNLTLMVEDDPEQANAVALLGYRVLLPETAENQRAPLHPNVERCADLDAVRRRALEILL